MQCWGRHAGLVLMMGAALGAVPAAFAQAPPDSLPPGVTAEMLAEGKRLWSGQGLCLACHGVDGKGGLGPDLTDGKWDHINGSFDQLVARIIKGVMPDESKSGQVMPPRGGGGLSDEQIKAVAAYVWTLNRRPAQE
ncbi:MAG TPA: cytochrome c [Gemmatimonadales bacterium]|nr:cytochrome c [Gemmatimonadales bacterium]